MGWIEKRIPRRGEKEKKKKRMEERNRARAKFHWARPSSSGNLKCVDDRYAALAVRRVVREPITVFDQAVVRE